MILSAPQPRMRLYTKKSTYVKIASDMMSGQMNRGADTQKLENEISRKTGTSFANCMPMARTGIYLVIKSLIKPGQKVILSPITIVNVVNMVLCAGGVPLFADVEPDTCNIDPNDLRKILSETPRKEVGAVLITHLHGCSCNLDEIQQICKNYNLPLIEDAAQAFSTKYQGKWVGSFGAAGIFSFGMYKNINSFFGGMVISNESRIIRLIKGEYEKFKETSKKDYLKKVFSGLATDCATSFPFFQIFTFWVFRFAYLNGIQSVSQLVSVDKNPKKLTQIPTNYQTKMSQMQARLVINQISKIEENNIKRINAAKIYNEGLKKLKDIIVPPIKNDGSHIYTYYPIRIKNRDNFVKHMMQKKRDVTISHYHNTASLDIFRNYFRKCRVAEKAAKELVYLPTYPDYAEKEIEKNIEAVIKFFS